MLPNVNFNPSFSNLAALRGMGGLPHPIRPIGTPVAPGSMPGWGGGAPMPGGPMMPGQDPGYSGIQQPMPMQGMPGQMPQNLGNLRALMALLGRQ